jgi:hypothetical protein
VRHALHIVEIAEMVMRKLGFRDIINCLRVSKHFNGIISSFKILGRSLWLVDIPYEETVVPASVCGKHKVNSTMHVEYSPDHD